MLRLWSRPPCNSAFDEDEDKGKDEDDYNWYGGEFDHDYEYLDENEETRIKGKMFSALNLIFWKSKEEKEGEKNKTQY